MSTSDRIWYVVTATLVVGLVVALAALLVRSVC